jgi:glycosyltransferase involved in cell wall biosynthesis
MSAKPKIAFFKTGKFSHVNQAMLECFRKYFPEYQVEVIDIFSDLIMKHNIVNITECLKLYSREILRGDKTISDCIPRTPSVFNKVKRAARRRLANQNYAFTFQTQSIFDTSQPGVPHFMYTDHTHLANLKYPEFKKKDLFSKSWIECEKQVYHNATLNFTMSSNITRSMIEDYCCPPEKVACVYCGANVQVAQDEIFDDNRYAGRNILFAGYDWERKGGPTLLEAFKIVSHSFPDASLTVVGNRPHLHFDHCRFVGNVSLSDMNKYYKEASIFCLPTKLEPFGIVFLEAMANKLPVVATNIGAIPDFIIEGENGYLVEPNNAEQLAQRLIALMASPDRCKAFGEYGHRLFWERYTWEKTGARMCENIERYL